MIHSFHSKTREMKHMFTQSYWESLGDILFYTSENFNHEMKMLSTKDLFFFWLCKFSHFLLGLFCFLLNWSSFNEDPLVIDYFLPFKTCFLHSLSWKIVSYVIQFKNGHFLSVLWKKHTIPWSCGFYC